MRHKLRSKRTQEKPAVRPPPAHPRGVATIPTGAEVDQAFDQPFAEGAMDAVDPDLRHRMISEAAFHRYAERGYDDSYERDDWLEAEAQVDHVTVKPTVNGEG
jgi:hypothetical protein